MVPNESHYGIVAGGATHRLDTVGSLHVSPFPPYRKEVVVAAPI